MARQISIAPNAYDRSNEQRTRTTIDERIGDSESILSGLRTSYGTISLGEGGVVLANGANNDVYPDFYTFARITGPTAAFSITGIRQGEKGRVLFLRNTTSQDMTIANESGSSTAANRILTNTGADVTLNGGGLVTLIYDATAQRWVMGAGQGTLDSPTFETSATVSGTSPELWLVETDAGADDGKWRLVADTEAFALQAVNDAENASENVFVVERTNETIDSVTFPNGAFNITETLTVTGNVTANGSAVAVGTTATTGAVAVTVGEGRSGDGFAWLDLVGDTTYTDYGLRVIRNNTGANATSQIVHRGTGGLYLDALDAGLVSMRTNGSERFLVDATGNAFSKNAHFFAHGTLSNFYVSHTTSQPLINFDSNDYMVYTSGNTLDFYIGGALVGRFGAQGLTKGGWYEVAENVALSGVAVDIAVPSWCVEMVIVLYQATTNDNAGDPAIQLGDAGGIEATGYVSSVGSQIATSIDTATNLFLLARSGQAAADNLSGTVHLISQRDQVTWMQNASMHSSAGTIFDSSGYKVLSDTCTTIRITTTNGTASFDGGVYGVFVR